jgi:gamma-glutamylputrescine oxidase
MTSSLPNQSFWLAKLERQPLQTDETLPGSVEVIVVGGGLTGVSTTYWLSSMGLRPLLLEQRELSHGATGRNGGHIMASLGTSFGAYIQSLGLDETLAVLEFVRENSRLLHEFVETHQIDCDLQDNDLVSFAINSQQAEHLRQAFEVMKPYGITTDFWDAERVAKETGSTAFQAGLVRPNHGQFWPAKLVVAMAQIAAHQGAQLMTETTVLSVERHDGHLTVHTNRGPIQTSTVVYATNALTHHLLPELKDAIVPVRAQAIATEPVPRLWDFDWSANDGYEYAIQRQDGRIILGGMRWRSPTKEVGIEDDESVEPNVSEGLRTYLGECFEALRDIKIDYEWTGIMGYTKDDLPLIGELAHRPGEYIAAGFTGQGMSYGFLAGKTLAEQLVKKTSSKIPKTFDPNRF